MHDNFAIIHTERSFITFLKMLCNLQWKEDEGALVLEQQITDRSDLHDRVLWIKPRAIMTYRT